MCRAGRPSGRRALQAAVRPRGDHAAVRRARAGEAAPARRSGEGLRRRDDLHVWRRHRRGVVARAVAAGPRDPAAERHAAARDLGRGRLGAADDPDVAQQSLRSARRALHLQGPRPHRRAAPRERAISRPSPVRSRTRSSSTRRAIARWKSSPAGSGSSRRWRSAIGCCSEPRSCSGTRPTCRHALENWINGLNTDWCVSRQRFFGVPFPVWYQVRDDGTIDHSARLLPGEERLPIDPSTDVPDGYSPAQRDQPGGFTRRSGHHGHLGDLVADAADRRAVGRGSGPVRARVPDGCPAAGARHHPHVAVLDGAAAPSSNTARCPGGTRRSPDGCSIPIARRCRSPRATSSRRWGCSRSTARTACAIGRRAAGRAPTRRSTPGR